MMGGDVEDGRWRRVRAWPGGDREGIVVGGGLVGEDEVEEYLNGKGEGMG